MGADYNQTSLALLEQLVYIDLYLNPTFKNDTPHSLELDDQLSVDLAVFADDSFVFPDETKASVSHRGGYDCDDVDIHRTPQQLLEENSSHFDQPKELIQGNSQLLPKPSSNSDSTGTDFAFTKEESSAGFLDIMNASFSGTPTPLQTPQISLEIMGSLPRYPVPPGANSLLQSVGLLQNQIDLLSALIAQHQTNLGSPNISISPVSSTPVARLVNYSPLSLLAVQGPDNEEHNTYPNVLLLLDRRQQPSPIELLVELQLHVRHHDPSRVQELIHNTIQPSVENTPLSIHAGVRNALPYHSNITFSSGSESSSQNGIPKLKQEYSMSCTLSKYDKRRRNTAALARFRVKKKMREKNMDAKLQEMEATIREFEIKIHRLEMENKLLRTLIDERGSKKSDEELEILRRKAAMQ